MRASDHRRKSRASTTPASPASSTTTLAVAVGFENGKVHHEHVYWDQASLLVQLGLLDAASLPVTGAQQARRLLHLARAYTR